VVSPVLGLTSSEVFLWVGIQVCYGSILSFRLAFLVKNSEYHGNV